MANYAKLPSALSNPKQFNSSLRLNDVTVAKSFYFTQEKKGSLFLETHSLYYVKQGSSVIKHGKIEYAVNEGQMLLLNKAVSIDYTKWGDQTGAFENLFFFLTDEFVAEFTKLTSIKIKHISEPILPSVKNVNDRLRQFFTSISGYFNSNENLEPGLLRIKLMELLYELSNIDQNLLHQLLQIKKQAPSEIQVVIENNYLSPVTLNDLAYLAGRSLASFKRDFLRTYNTSPASWIRKRRLDKARELLASTSMSVSEICFSTGFESPAHFTKLYKETFGVTPSSFRNN